MKCRPMEWRYDQAAIVGIFAIRRTMFISFASASSMRRELG